MYITQLYTLRINTCPHPGKTLLKTPPPPSTPPPRQLELERENQAFPTRLSCSRKKKPTQSAKLSEDQKDPAKEKPILNVRTVTGAARRGARRPGPSDRLSRCVHNALCPCPGPGRRATYIRPPPELSQDSITATSQQGVSDPRIHNGRTDRWHLLLPA